MASIFRKNHIYYNDKERIRVNNMLGYILLAGSLIGANVIGYNIYSKRKSEKNRKRFYRDENGEIKESIVITLKPEDIKEVK